ncbi:hypothetical protein HPB47_008586 [Ixodes persulcatus]|uniref:Uncharacterized protein n=1 Tax=Ixodes persulcatus TaxID=34615 RepID=A0AC60P4T6_IXOPE|nr:hypothetical protein HPB47_008586 [Ixodes persulcatus]
MAIPRRGKCLNLRRKAGRISTERLLRVTRTGRAAAVGGASSGRRRAAYEDLDMNAPYYPGAAGTLSGWSHNLFGLTAARDLLPPTCRRVCPTCGADTTAPFSSPGSL